MMPAYGHFAEICGRGDPAELESILDQLWRDILGENRMRGEDLQAALTACMRLIPREDEGAWIPEQAAAEDGASAVAYAVRCRQCGDANEAAWAGRRAYEALDHFVATRDRIGADNPHAEQSALSHPIVQAELLRQERDLDDLGAPDTQDGIKPIVSVRERARGEASMFFGTDQQTRSSCSE
jgi:hypothetical protein